MDLLDGYDPTAALFDAMRGYWFLDYFEMGSFLVLLNIVHVLWLFDILLLC